MKSLAKMVFVFSVSLRVIVPVFSFSDQLDPMDVHKLTSPLAIWDWIGQVKIFESKIPIHRWDIRYDGFELDRDKAEKTCGDWAWTHRPPSSKVTKIPNGHKTKCSEFSHLDHPQIITQFRNPKITAQLIIRVNVTDTVFQRVRTLKSQIGSRHQL